MFGFTNKKDFAECFKNDKDYQIALFAVKRFESALKENMIYTNGNSNKSIYFAINDVSEYLRLKYNSDSNGYSLIVGDYFNIKKTIKYISNGKFELSNYAESTIYTLLKNMYDNGGYEIFGRCFEEEI